MSDQLLFYQVYNHRILWQGDYKPNIALMAKYKVYVYIYMHLQCI